jgi:hypothetical protein
MSIINLTPTQLRKAADLQEEIAKLQTQLSAIAGNQTFPPVQIAKPAKRKMSASAIAKIRAAQKARWAAIKAVKPVAKPVTAKAPKKKGGMSAAGRARIVAAQKARWAKIKAAKAASVAKSVVVPKLGVAAKLAAKSAPISKPAKKKISAEGIARIKAAQKARWAKIHAEKSKK